MKSFHIISLHELIKSVGFFLTVGLVLLLIGCGKTEEKSHVVQNPLPYEIDALKPYISDQTLRFHYNKHYAGYVKKANQLLKKSDLKGKTVEEIIGLTSGEEKYKKIFNNVAQVWNHAFFWKCLKPEGGGIPPGELADQIKASFGSFDVFKDKFIEAAGNCFGSGWIWLVQDAEKLKIVTTGNADTPIAHDLKPVFAVDVWEHAYYLDYQNRRADFVENVLDHLANWDFVASQLKPVGKRI
jgi:Fe-Mn family superoxide dismutase